MSSTIMNFSLDDIRAKLENKGCKLIDSPTFSKGFTHVDRRGDNIFLRNTKYMISDQKYDDEKIRINKELSNINENELGKEQYEKIVQIYKEALMSKEKYENIVGKIIENQCKNEIGVVSGGITYMQNDGVGGKKYSAHSSQSFSIPQVSAIYALARQMDNNISYDEFYNICKSTCIKEKCNLINPEGIVRQINEQNREKSLINKEYEKVYEESSKLISKLDKLKEIDLKTIEKKLTIIVK